jgi:hypothetical protein
MGIDRNTSRAPDLFPWLWQDSFGGDARLPAGQDQVGNLHVDAGAAGAVFDVTHWMPVRLATAAFAAPEAVSADNAILTWPDLAHPHSQLLS